MCKRRTFLYALQRLNTEEELKAALDAALEKAKQECKRQVAEAVAKSKDDETKRHEAHLAQERQQHEAKLAQLNQQHAQVWVVGAGADWTGLFPCCRGWARRAIRRYTPCFDLALWCQALDTLRRELSESRGNEAALQRQLDELKELGSSSAHE